MDTKSKPKKKDEALRVGQSLYPGMDADAAGEIGSIILDDPEYQMRLWEEEDRLELERWREMVNYEW